MSASYTPPITAIAFQLSAALERYQMLVDALANPSSQKAQYDLVSRVFDQVRMLKGALPELSVDMVEVLIRHVALMKALWLSASSAVNDDAVAQARRNHSQAVDAMYEHCLRVFSRPK
jgi:hypothetical protein